MNKRTDQIVVDVAQVLISVKVVLWARRIEAKKLSGVLYLRAKYLSEPLPPFHFGQRVCLPVSRLTSNLRTTRVHSVRANKRKMAQKN